MLKQFRGDGASEAIQYAFKVLDRAGLKNHPRTQTQWSMVFDLGARTILLKTSLNPAIRKIDIKAMDFACPGMPETVDIHTPLTVVGNGDFWKYDYEMNRRRFHGVFAKHPMKNASLRRRLDRISRYPETFVCEKTTKP